MKHTIATAALAATLLVGGASAVAVLSPALATAQDDEAPDTTTEDSTTEDDAEDGTTDLPAHEDWVREALTPLVDAGTLTSSQADAVVAALEEARPGRGPGWGGRGHGGGGRGVGGPGVGDGFGGPGVGMHGLGLSTAAEVLGLTPEELHIELSEGQSLADVAAAEGVEVQSLIDALVAAHEERLDERVAAGDLTEEQAAEHLAEAEERIADLVESVRGS